MSSKSSIAVCSTSYYEYDRRLQRIISSLISNDYTIFWLSRKHSVKSENLPNVNHIVIDTKFKSGPLFYLEFNWKISRLLNKIDCNYINANDLDTLLGAFLAARKSNCKLAFDAHEIFYEVPELNNKPIKKFIWKQLASWLIPKTDASYTVNNALKEHHESKYSKSFKIVRNVPLKSIKNNISKGINNKTLAYLGVLNKGRGIDLAIDFIKATEDYSLVIIGEGDLSQELRIYADNHPRIIFTGYVNPKEISKVLSKAAIGINILTAESMNYRLSLANKFFDYMHTGLPSINMDYPEYNHLIKANEVGLLIKDYSLADFSNAVLALENKNLYKKLHQNALEASNKYTWQNEEQKLISVYASL